MPEFSPDLANRILLRQSNITAPDPHQRSFEYRFDGSNSRWMIVSRDKHKDWVRVYMNRQSCLLEWFPVSGPSSAFPGVEVGFRYVKGHRGESGFPGIASSAAKRRSLMPENDHVLMLHCSSEAGFRQLARWYAGDFSLGPGSEPSPDEVSGKGWYQPVVRTPALPTASISSASDTPPPPSTAAPSEPPLSSVAAHPLPSCPSTEDVLLDVKSSGQGWMQDSERRACVEARAVALARARYEQMHYAVTELGKPYDLHCSPTPGCPSGAPEIHVEVKGSVGPAESVIVTYNEVEHAHTARIFRTDLVCVSNIVLVQQPDGAWVGTGGDLAFIEDWRPAAEDLQATEYRYRLPPMTRA